MIYRIAIGTIVDGKWKFDRYANDINLLSLRITPDGRVEMIDRIFHPLEHEEYDLLQLSTTLMCGYHTGACDKQIWLRWVDVSETHKVEWGCVHEDKALYENDIVTAEYSLFQDDGKYNYHGLLYYDEESYCMGLGYICVANDKRGISDGIGNSLCEFEDLILLGNINENPELLDKEG